MSLTFCLLLTVLSYLFLNNTTFILMKLAGLYLMKAGLILISWFLTFLGAFGIWIVFAFLLLYRQSITDFIL
jgi:hypothetical protein